MRGESILYGSYPIKKAAEVKKSFPLPRIKDLREDSSLLGLDEWIESDDWSGGHFWIARGPLPPSWKKEGQKIKEPNDFLALISRAKAHISALGKAEEIHFSPDFGGERRAEPMRDVLDENEKYLAYINSDYLEASLRVAGEPERWHFANLNGRNTILGFKEEEPIIILSPAR